MNESKTKIVPIVQVECDCCAHVKKNLFECPLENCSYSMCADCCKKTWDGTDTSKCPACRRERWPFYDMDTNEPMTCPYCILGFPFKCPRCWDYINHCWNPDRIVVPIRNCVACSTYNCTAFSHGIIYIIEREETNIIECITFFLTQICKLIFCIIGSFCILILGRLVWFIFDLGYPRQDKFWTNDTIYFIASGVVGAIILCCCCSIFSVCCVGPAMDEYD